MSISFRGLNPCLALCLGGLATLALMGPLLVMSGTLGALPSALLSFASVFAAAAGLCMIAARRSGTSTGPAVSNRPTALCFHHDDAPAL
jgi:hypothetical protein